MGARADIGAKSRNAYARYEQGERFRQLKNSKSFSKPLLRTKILCGDWQADDDSRAASRGGRLRTPAIVQRSRGPKPLHRGHGNEVVLQSFREKLLAKLRRELIAGRSDQLPNNWMDHEAGHRARETGQVLDEPLLDIVHGGQVGLI